MARTTAALKDAARGPSRRRLLKACAGAAMLAGPTRWFGRTTALCAAAEAAPPAARRPNFIFILVDDLRFDAMGCVTPFVKTPNIDAVARRGVRFTDSFVTTSICSPSRACCLTGRYGSANGVMGLDQAFRPGEKTFALYLKQAGYRTGFVGKWHVAKTGPRDNGFDFAVHFQANGPMHDRQVITADGPTTAKGFIEDYNAGQAVTFLESAAKGDAPFCLHLCTQSPHMLPQYGWEPAAEFLALYDESKMPVPASWKDDLSGKPAYLAGSRFRTQAASYGYGAADGIRRHWRQYLAAVSEMDRSLGAVIAACDRLGLWANTHVLLMGDNGWMMGEHGFTSKVLPYEEAIRVPLVWAGPGIREGTEGRMVLNADLAPTMLDLAGLPAPANMHGRSLSPILRREAPQWRESILYEALKPELGSRPLVAVRTNEWKYIQTFESGNVQQAAFEELYSLRTDVAEMKNLAAAAEQKPTIDRLRAELARLRKAVAETG